MFAFNIVVGGSASFGSAESSRTIGFASAASYQQGHTALLVVHQLQPEGEVLRDVSILTAGWSILESVTQDDGTMKGQLSIWWKFLEGATRELEPNVTVALSSARGGGASVDATLFQIHGHTWPVDAVNQVVDPEPLTTYDYQASEYLATATGTLLQYVAIGEFDPGSNPSLSIANANGWGPTGTLTVGSPGDRGSRLRDVTPGTIVSPVWRYGLGKQMLVITCALTTTDPTRPPWKPQILFL